MQVLHHRNVLVDIAGEGARQAARYESNVSSGEKRVKELAQGVVQLGSVKGTIESRGDAQIAVFTVTAKLPLLGPIGIENGITVKGHALVEGLDN